MQPILFLQSGDTGTIKRISGAEDTRRFLAEVTVVSQFDGNLIVNIKDSRVAVNKEMARHIMV
jgi:ferrous iron transport protein A